MNAEEAQTMRSLQLLLDDYTKQHAALRGRTSNWQTPTVVQVLADAERLLSQPVSTS